ncbi:MAG: hypothetical protein ABI905_17400, partial [Betaproteobacteria bacterium]
MDSAPSLVKLKKLISNSSTGAYRRPKTAGEARQCLSYMLLRRHFFHIDHRSCGHTQGFQILVPQRHQ